MARNRYADDTIKHQLRLRAQYTKIAREAEQHLRVLQKDLRSEVDRILRSGGSVANLRRSLRVVDDMVADSYDVMKTLVADRMGEIYQSEFDWSAQRFGVKRSVGITKRQLESIVLNDPFDGKILSEWISEQSLQTQNRIKRAIRSGVSLGVARNDIAAQLINNDLFKGSESNARILVRTAGAHFSAQADIKAFEETGFEKYQLSAVLDTRTTTICASLDGKVFSVKDPKRLVPPFHPGCRTTMIPYDDEDEPIKENYEQWLTKQSVEDQKEVLGETRYKLWMSGESLDSFVDEKTLTQKPISDL